MIGGNITGQLQKRTGTVKNEIGEHVKTWETIHTLKGFLDLSNGDSRRNSFDAKMQESTHYFICDYFPIDPCHYIQPFLGHLGCIHRLCHCSGQFRSHRLVLLQKRLLEKELGKKSKSVRNCRPLGRQFFFSTLSLKSTLFAHLSCNGTKWAAVVDIFRGV